MERQNTSPGSPVTRALGGTPGAQQAVIVVFERDETLSGPLLGQLGWYGYACQPARTPVDVMAALADAPVAAVLVNLGQAAAGRREFWVALEAQQRERGVQVVTYRVIAPGVALEPGSDGGTVLADVQLRSPQALEALIEAVRARLPAPPRQGPEATLAGSPQVFGLADGGVRPERRASAAALKAGLPDARPPAGQRPAVASGPARPLGTLTGPGTGAALPERADLGALARVPGRMAPLEYRNRQWLAERAGAPGKPPETGAPGSARPPHPAQAPSGQFITSSLDYFRLFLPRVARPPDRGTSGFRPLEATEIQRRWDALHLIARGMKYLGLLLAFCAGAGGLALVGGIPHASFASDVVPALIGEAFGSRLIAALLVLLVNGLVVLCLLAFSELICLLIALEAHTDWRRK